MATCWSLIGKKRQIKYCRYCKKSGHQWQECYWLRRKQMYQENMGHQEHSIENKVKVNSKIKINLL